ncbi:MAG: diadenylate cyclase CdaA [Vulcanimicrobiota bacterium]
MSFLQNLISNFTFKDIIDILLVAGVIYLFLSLIKGTRAVQIIQGVLVLLSLLILSYVFKLEALYWLLRYLMISLAVAIPIVFQPELRRALGTIGRGSVFPSFNSLLGKETIAQIVDELTWTATILSQAKIGALIVIERETGLQEFIETGIPVDGKVSSKLLLSIFMPKSPLHDGAVILRGKKVVAASCYLPLSQGVSDASHDTDMGTRHLAALGISEQSDAVVLVVSEETGAISVINNGSQTKNLNEESLKKILTNVYSRDSENVLSFARIGGSEVVQLFKKQSES